MHRDLQPYLEEECLLCNRCGETRNMEYMTDQAKTAFLLPDLDGLRYQSESRPVSGGRWFWKATSHWYSFRCLFQRCKKVHGGMMGSKCALP